MTGGQKKKRPYVKKDDRWLHLNGIKVPHFHCKQRSGFIFRNLVLKKGLESFVTEYMPDVRTIIS